MLDVFFIIKNILIQKNEVKFSNFKNYKKTIKLQINAKNTLKQNTIIR